MAPQAIGTPAFSAGLRNLALKHEGVTILFTDVVGFTSMSKDREPHQVGGGTF